MAGLAGCGGSSDGDTSNGGGTSEGGGGGNTPVSDTLSVTVNNVASQSNLQPWATTVKNTGLTWITELAAPQDPATGEYKLSGSTFDAPWVEGTDQIQVYSMLKDMTVNPPYEWTWELEDLQYWDGTDIDAEARRLHDRVYYFNDGNKFVKTSTFNYEVVDKWTYKGWRNKGEVEGQEKDPANKFVIRGKNYPSGPSSIPFHPGFTKQWVQKFEDASTKEAVNSVSKELGSTRVSFGKFAEEGWGSGLYQIESRDDVSDQGITAKLRDDHPNAEHATIPNLEMMFANGDRTQVLTTNGKVDIGNGYIPEKSAGTGGASRATLPDYIQQIQEWLQLGGDTLMFNWKHNKHLGRLWFRRAVVAATDWDALRQNGWGVGVSKSSQHHTGMLDTLAEQTFSKEFLDKLYTYPIKSDMALAEKWLKKGGYSKQGGKWVGPDGDTASFEVNYYGPTKAYIGATQTMQANMQDLGVNLNVKGLPNTAFSKALKPENENYDAVFTWDNDNEPWKEFWSHGNWWRMGFISGDPNDNPGQAVVDYQDHGSQHRDTVDTLGRPLQPEIPKEIGSIEAPDQAGRDPDLPNGETIDLAKIIHKLRAPDISDDEYQTMLRQCARWYNFYLPDFHFHQYKAGLYGNVRDFKFAPQGKQINQLSKEFGGDDFQVLGGIPQVKYNTDYEKP
ncbi:ABC transporter substrate-binding protein [Halarchaeum sp. P4]|uniref:ABC transporter substrate-binding protein n=1 Tax=Halarchaeum sp. P4 TaxID=3421639 RepID=UPI003EBA44B9